MELHNILCGFLMNILGQTQQPDLHIPSSKNELHCCKDVIGLWYRWFVWGSDMTVLTWGDCTILTLKPQCGFDWRGSSEIWVIHNYTQNSSVPGGSKQDNKNRIIGEEETRQNLPQNHRARLELLLMCSSSGVQAAGLLETLCLLHLFVKGGYRLVSLSLRWLRGVIVINMPIGHCPKTGICNVFKDCLSVSIWGIASDVFLKNDSEKPFCCHLICGKKESAKHTSSTRRLALKSVQGNSWLVEIGSWLPHANSHCLQ